MNTYNKTIAFDFDGVIHRYSKGWEDGSIYDRPVDGIINAINKLKEEGYEIIIYSTRAKYLKSRKEMKKWLDNYDIPYDEISKDKPIATMYVDDRAINFNGNCKKMIENIHTFRSWIEKSRKICPYCGEEFFAYVNNYNRKKYCSKECRIKYNIEKEKEKYARSE